MIRLSLDAQWNYCSDSYGELFANASATAFQHPDWLDLQYRELAPAHGAEPLTITIDHQHTRQLMAVLPLMRVQRRGVKIVEFADLGVTDYCAPVVRNGCEALLSRQPDLSKQLLNQIGPCDVFRVKAIRQEHAYLLEALTGAIPEPAGFSAHEALLERPYDEWRQNAFSKGHIRNIDRRRRRFDRLGDTRLECIADPDAARAAIGELRQLRHGRFDGDPIQSDSVHAFYAEIAARGATNGYARTYRLAENGNTAGIVFGTVHHGRYNYLLIGCDYETYAKCSPGLIMYDRIMADWTEAGGTIFDFTIGDEPFKTNFGTRPVDMFSINKPVSLAGQLASSAQSLVRRFA